MALDKIKKRDGTLVRFKLEKISVAIEKAMLSIGRTDTDLAKELAEKVRDLVVSFTEKEVPDVEEIQDLVEKVLMDEGHTEIAKAYILYRQKRTELRKLKKRILGRLDDSSLSINGLLIAKSRYLRKKKNGEIETPREMFRRVARTVARAEEKYDKTDKQIEDIEEDFFEIINSLEFVPSGRILRGAGTEQNMLYSSFVIPVKDSMKSIFKALYNKALIQRLGGGTGFSFSRLRPKGEKLETTGGHSSGPIAFIKLFDHSSDLTVHSGNRKAASMGSLSVQHPDIIEFITMKDRSEIKNFNLSVEMTDEFMQAVKNREKYPLKNPATGEVVEKMDANNIFHLIVTMAWKTGDPGVLFIDKINEMNPLPKVGKIETTDPCGDQLLLAYEGGNLGAINLSEFVRNERMQWKRMQEVVETAVRFLDNVVDVCDYPIKKSEKIAKNTRRIGLGVMGFADMLYKLRIPYDSDKALEIGQKVMKHIYDTAYETSEKLAEEKDVFPLYKKSVFRGERKMRNASLIAISPTGTRSVLIETSPGIEPNFALGYTRKVMGAIEIQQLNKVLEEVLKEYDLYDGETIRKIITTGSLEGVDLPDEIKKVFVTAYDISPEMHIKMQAVFQKYNDNAISKTINFRKNATIEDIKDVYLKAYDWGCKGITVYREGSLSDEVIKIGGSE